MDMVMPYLNYILALVGVIVLIVVLSMVLRLIGGRARGRKGLRLGIVEYCEIDQSRRLVLLRRDGVEHLVLIGGPQDVVIETGIGDESLSSAAMQASPPEVPPAAEDVVPLRAPRAPVFGARRPVLRPIVPGDDDNTPA